MPTHAICSGGCGKKLCRRIDVHWAGSDGQAMTTFTLVATGQTQASLDVIADTVRAALHDAGVELVECNWAPDLDTVSDAVPGNPTLALVDLN